MTTRSMYADEQDEDKERDDSRQDGGAAVDPRELIDQFVTGPMTGDAVNAATVAFKKALIERALGAELSPFGLPERREQARGQHRQPAQRQERQDCADR